MTVNLTTGRGGHGLQSYPTCWSSPLGFEVASKPLPETMSSLQPMILMHTLPLFICNMNHSECLRGNVYLKGSTDLDTAHGVPLFFRQFTQWDRGSKEARVREGAIPDSRSVISP